jgi:hypothetical protein
MKLHIYRLSNGSWLFSERGIKPNGVDRFELWTVQSDDPNQILERTQRRREYEIATDPTWVQNWGPAKIRLINPGPPKERAIGWETCSHWKFARLLRRVVRLSSEAGSTDFHQPTWASWVSSSHSPETQEGVFWVAVYIARALMEGKTNCPTNKTGRRSWWTSMLGQKVTLRPLRLAANFSGDPCRYAKRYAAEYIGDGSLATFLEQHGLPPSLSTRVEELVAASLTQNSNGAFSGLGYQRFRKLITRCRMDRQTPPWFDKWERGL